MCYHVPSIHKNNAPSLVRYRILGHRLRSRLWSERRRNHRGSHVHSNHLRRFQSRRERRRVDGLSGLLGTDRVRRHMRRDRRHRLPDRHRHLRRGLRLERHVHSRGGHLDWGTRYVVVMVVLVMAVVVGWWSWWGGGVKHLSDRSIQVY